MEDGPVRRGQGEELSAGKPPVMAWLAKNV